jgi:hypothetical protein
MTIWLLLAQLFALGYPTPPPSPPVFQQAQESPKPVLPAHVRGPHEGEDGAKCYRGETRSPGAGLMLYQCACQMLCEEGAGGERLQREADDCETACGHNQCLCHVDETCQMPTPKPKKGRR